MTRDAAPAGDTDDRVLGLLRRGHDAGRAVWGEFDLPFEVYRDFALERADRRLVRLGGDDASDVAAVLQRAALADVYLAAACDRGSERAWEALDRAMRTKLVGVARRRGVGAAETDALIGDVLGEMALPAPRGGTLIGTFDGTGSLQGWLSVILARRIAKTRARAGRETSVPGRHAPVRSREPIHALVDQELATRLEAAMRAFWSELDPEERLVVLLKHESGLSGRAIARVLGLSEPTVSRRTSAATARLRAAVQDLTPPDDLEPGTTLWALLAEALRRSVRERLPVDAPSDPEGHR